MQALPRPVLTTLLLLPALVPAARAGGVQILGKPGLGTPTSIQTAVDLAQDGDSLLVGPGTYAAFRVEAKGLTIVAATPGTVDIQGKVTVGDLSWKQTVLMSGLSCTGAALDGLSDPALEVVSNQGHVRLQDCTLTGGAGTSAGDCMPWGSAGSGAVLTDNTRVALVRCTVVGGVGYGEPGGSNSNECAGGAGGAGILASDSAVALYDCTVWGGDGGDGEWRGGDGGHGCLVTTYGVFASGTAFEGGEGGKGQDTFGVGGDGGDGLRVEDEAQAQLLDCTFAGGLFGYGIYISGQPGNPWSGTGVIKFHPGAARAFTGAGLAAEGQKVLVTVTGTPGDQLFLPQSVQPDWVVPFPKTGIWLVPPPKWFAWPPLAVVQSNGQAHFKWPGSVIQGAAVSRTVFLQGYALDTGGTSTLGSPLHVTVLNRDGLPDCNGNGVLDVLDVLEGTSADVDGNLNPDECDPDCNGNAIIDGLDILNGFSADSNGNGTPDECEGGGPVWYVDPAAVGPGVGTAAAPYPTLALAWELAASGDTILLRDGTYVGPSNRGLDFAGRDLIVASENGAAACILDCRGYDRAFLLRSGESLGARIEGLTIRDGDAGQSTELTGLGGAIAADSGTPTVAGCVIQDCRATHGGGLSLMAGTVEDTLIEDCTASSRGGGLHSEPGTQTANAVVLRRSTIRRSSAANGGGAYIRPIAKKPVISHCRIEENDSSGDGGGLYLAYNGKFNHTVDNCLIAGNTAGGDGGGLFVMWGDMELSNDTWVGNQAGGAGGAISFQGLPAGGDLLNSIVWDSSQGAGTAIDHNGQSLKVARCDVQGGMGAVSGTGALNWVNSLDSDPLFLDPDGPDGDPATFLDNDYRLAQGSPCADAAGNGNVPPDKSDVDDDGNLLEQVPLDLDLTPRFVDDPTAPDTGSGTAPIVDMGAYERP